jgi:hypothetical protein
MANKRHLKMLLFNYLNPRRTECIFLFDDMTFKRGIIVDGNPLEYNPISRQLLPSYFLLKSVHTLGVSILNGLLFSGMMSLPVKLFYGLNISQDNDFRHQLIDKLDIDLGMAKQIEDFEHGIRRLITIEPSSGDRSFLDGLSVIWVKEP